MLPMHSHAGRDAGATMHYLTPPRADAETLEVARQAVSATYLHWGLHGWAVYVVVGVSLAYFAYRHNLPLSLVSAGLNHVFGTGSNQVTQLIVIALITAAATASVLAGLDGGIKRLSNINLYLAAGLFVFVVLAGSTAFVFNGTLQSIGVYAQNLISNAFYSETFIDKDWQAEWTLLYWGWWIAWSPFVGVFVARISRGRTIRDHADRCDDREPQFRGQRHAVVRVRRAAGADARHVRVVRGVR